ncbi:MAG: glycosyltransferase family 39 protein [Anaerolineae bacterium]|nr:glycosyltransferase family 39 protein [Anaerolineae bacterium]
MQNVSIYTKKPTSLEWLAFAVIVIIAAVLRLGAPGIVEFKRDEANLSSLALDMARGRGIPLLGIDSSVGIRNAPVNAWIMAVPYLFSSDPVVATQYVGLLNVGAVILTYLLARRYYGPIAAVSAGLMFAVSPWAVVYSRKIWAQDLLPLFIVATVATGLIGFVEGKRWAQWLHLPLLSWTGQIHYVTFVLIPITLLLLFIGRRRLTRAFYLSLVLTVLITLPFLIGIAQEARAHPEEFQRIATSGIKANQPSDKARPLGLTGDAAQFAWLTITGTDIHSFAGADAFRQYLASVPNAYPIFNAFGVLMLLAAIWLWVRTLMRSDARTPVDLTLLVWLVFTPLVFSLTWTRVYPHYMVVILPAAFLVLGAGLSDAWRGLSDNPLVRRLVLTFGLVTLVSIAGLDVWLKVSLLNFLNVTNTPGGFGTPLGYFSPIREKVVAEQPAHTLANLDGQYIGYHDETTVWNFLLYDLPDRRYLDDVTEIYPAEPALYLSHHCTDQTQNYYLRTAQEGCYTITTRRAGDFDPAAYTPITDADQFRFANSAQLTAYRWDTQQGCLTVVWNTERGPFTEDFSMAVQFVNNSGERILNADGLSLRGQYWRPGDIVTRRFCLPYGQERIAEITGVLLGFYTSTDTPEGKRFEDVPLLDHTGAEIGRKQEIKF